METNFNSYEEVGSGLRSLESFHSTEPDATFTSHFQSNFKPVKVLGQGGFGFVFEAEKHVMGKLTLWRGDVKRIPMKKGENEIGKALKEVEALLKFDHEGIVKFYDAWAEQPPDGWQRSADNDLLEHLNSQETFIYKDDSAFLYIQMELCQSTLADWLAENQECRDLNTIKDWFRQIVSAVAYIHKMNYIHRDLKPSNILFAGETYRGEKILKVCDLGIVQFLMKMNGKSENFRRNELSPRVQKCTCSRTDGMGRLHFKSGHFALGLILAEMLVVMPTERAQEAFDNYRCGRPNTILEDIPEAETFVAWLTNPNDSERPDSREIEHHKFTLSEQRQRDIKRATSIRRGRIRTLARGLGATRRINQLEAKIAALTNNEAQNE